MAKKTRSVANDVELDRGSGQLGLAVAEVVSPTERQDRAADREGLAELDAMVEARADMLRRTKDANRAIPRDASLPLNERTAHRVPEYPETRVPISDHQMRERSRVKQAVQEKWTEAQHRSVRALVTDPAEFTRISDKLSDAAGDIEQLSSRDQRVVRRVDRAIRQYEESNDRQHVVYCNAQLPEDVDDESLKTYDSVYLDRWTAGEHNLSALDGHPSHVYEVITRRGMYLGHSAGGSSTAHLLPRGMRFEVEEVYDAKWKDADGTLGMRRVIRLREK